MRPIGTPMQRCELYPVRQLARLLSARVLPGPGAARARSISRQTGVGESWDGLRLGLMAFGYQQVIWTHCTASITAFSRWASLMRKWTHIPSRMPSHVQGQFCGARFHSVRTPRSRENVQALIRPNSPRTLAEPRYRQAEAHRRPARAEIPPRDPGASTRLGFSSQGQQLEKLGYARRRLDAQETLSQRAFSTYPQTG